MNNMNIPYLKSLNCEPQWFGLGFIQMKLNQNERLHFWSEEIKPTINEQEFHNHRYDFHSRILKGYIDDLTIIKSLNRTICPQETYFMPDAAFHKSSPRGNVITHLIRGDG